MYMTSAASGDIPIQDHPVRPPMNPSLRKRFQIAVSASAHTSSDKPHVELYIFSLVAREEECPHVES